MTYQELQPRRRVTRKVFRPSTVLLTQLASKLQQNNIENKIRFILVERNCFIDTLSDEIIQSSEYAYI